MPSRTLVRAFVTLWWTLGFVVLFLSVRTVLHEVSSNASQRDSVPLLIYSAAVLFVLYHGPVPVWSRAVHHA